MKSSYLCCNYLHLSWRDVQALNRASRYEEGPVLVVGYPDGFFVQVPSLCGGPGLVQELLRFGYSDGLIELVRHAHASDCTLIRLDRNGPILPGFATHDL